MGTCAMGTHRNPETEGGSFAWLTPDRDVTAQELRAVLAESEAQALLQVFPTARRVELSDDLEHRIDLFLAHALTGVRHMKRDPVSAAARFALHFEGDRAFSGVVTGFVKEVANGV